MFELAAAQQAADEVTHRTAVLVLLPQRLKKF